MKKQIQFYTNEVKGMARMLTLPNYIFVKNEFQKYHYTDNRRGSPLHYTALMLKGHARIVSEHNEIAVGEGTLFYIPKDLPYQSYWYGEEEIQFLSFGFQQLNCSEKLNFALQTVNCGEELKERLKAISMEGQDVSCRTLGRYYSVMADLLPLLQPANQSRDNLIAEAAKRYIEQNPDCSVPEAARACGISEPYLYAIFKRTVKASPNDYRQQILCRKGIELLTSTDRTVEEISSMLNLSSAAHFRKILKKHVGLSPREIRRERGF
ncbi:MAG: helix-turn-helix transcriptional regulator [Clostridia bacterium]|nr:helix-turn-helix transcriptional regulator [Clostridia bacterium]